MMKRTEFYEAPTLDIYRIATERGFAQSLGGGLTDYESGGSDSFDD